LDIAIAGGLAVTIASGVVLAAGKRVATAATSVNATDNTSGFVSWTGAAFTFAEGAPASSHVTPVAWIKTVAGNIIEFVLIRALPAPKGTICKVFASLSIDKKIPIQLPIAFMREFS
jgi:hypothetical protein